jgi:hypothetical protein
MMLNEEFQIASGSVAGRDHRMALKNNHDAYYHEASPGVLVAVVCDGCGSGAHSEVGAKLGARMVAKQVLRWYRNDPGAFRPGQIDRGLMQVRRSVLGQIHMLADSMAGGFTDVIGDYFLFTVMGAILTQDDAFVFGCGDGVVCLNERLTNHAAEGNKPEYLAYGLVETEGGGAPILRCHGQERLPLVKSILLGTDGVNDLVAAVDLTVPGKDEKVGPLSQFWTDDHYFKNVFSLQRRLNLINRSVSQVDYAKKSVSEEHGRLTDDTTIVVLRRKPGGKP